MGNVLLIFINDLRAISKQFFAFVIAVAVCVIPALYAWFNIFSNWDPYGGTGNISIALVTRDQGFTTDDGEYKNEGAAIVEEMAAGTSIHWVPTDYGEAMEGVRSGKYYGALVLGENLSRNMYRITEALYDQAPSITFYQNAKTNAIANKITETAASTAEHNIQERYLSILIENLFGTLDGIVEDMDAEKTVDDLIRILETLKGRLTEYRTLIEEMQTTNIVLGRRLHEAGDNTNVNFNSQLSSLSDAVGSIEYTKVQTMTNIWDLQERLAGMQQRLADVSAISDGLSVATVQEIMDQNTDLMDDIDLMIKSISDLGARETLRTLYRSLESIQDRLETLRGVLENSSSTPSQDVQNLVNSILNMIGYQRVFVHERVEPAVSNLFDNMIEDLQLLQEILISVEGTVDQVPPVLYAADGTLYAMNGTLKQVGNLLKNLQESLDKLIVTLTDARNNDTVETLIEMLHGDPEEFASFLSDPVTVETWTIYPVNSYGTAMTPFYSTLGLWVGCVVLTAVLKVEADGKGLRRKPTNAQLYWGRFLTFFFFGQIQSAIIVWGDLHILGVACLHPGLFYLTGAITSFVFVCLIYSFVLTFGDVGKAIVVVIMIVQIAGSSGSYPIEILPPIFEKIFLFFPYPYAINAMREAICGLYRLDYLKYIGELLVFGGLGLVVGLILREPFHGINEFVEEEMHESGVL